MRTFRGLLWACFLFALSPAASAAQATSVLTGVVSVDGSPIAGVTVTAVAGAQRRQAITDVDGRYRIEALPAGSYRVTADAGGFRPAVAESVAVAGETTHNVALVLRLTGDTVQVLAETTRVATKAPAAVIEIPQAVTIIPEQVLTEQQTAGLPDVVRNVSGIIHNSKNRGADDEFSLRGFFADGSGNFRRNGVEVNKFDDLINANAERVEILKGPSSVLYGRLDPGGVINVVTKAPLTRRLHTMDIRLSQYAGMDARLDTTGPLTGNGRWLYRLNLSGERRDSYRDQVTFRKWFASPVVTTQLGARARLTVEGEFKGDRGTSDSGIVAATSTFAALDAVSTGQFVGEPDARFERTHAAGLSTLDWTLHSQWQLRATVHSGRYDRNPHDIVPGAVQADGRTLTRSADFRDQERRFLLTEGQLTGTFQLGRLQYDVTAGAGTQSIDLDEERRRGTATSIDLLTPRYSGLPTGLPLTTNAQQRIDLFGAFGQVRAGVGAVRVQAGLRFSDLEQRDRNLLTGGSTLIAADAWSPQLGVVVMARPWLSVYGSFARSFTPITFISGDTVFDPSSGEQFEGGVKAELLDRRLAVTAAVYQLTNDNLLSFFRNPTTGIFEVAQGGQHRTTGVELDVNGRISDHVSLIGHYTTMNGRVITDPAFQPGRRIGGAPEHTGSLWLSVTKNDWTVAAGAFGRTQMKGFTSSDAFLPGYVTADAMAAWRRSPRLRLQLNVSNVFDRRTYITGAGSNIAYPGTPRSVKGAVTLTF